MSKRRDERKLRETVIRALGWPSVAEYRRAVRQWRRDRKLTRREMRKNGFVIHKNPRHFPGVCPEYRKATISDGNV